MIGWLAMSVIGVACILILFRQGFARWFAIWQPLNLWTWGLVVAALAPGVGLLFLGAWLEARAERGPAYTSSPRA